MKKITLLLFALLAFASIVMSTNKKDDMTTAIKIDTSRPLPDQIPCNDIDSIAYSAILDSTGRTVGYNQNVFTPDTILAYPVDSIRQTEFMDITDDEVVRKNFSNLSDYMESQGFTGKDASTVRDNIKSWLTSQPEVEGVTLINDDTDIKISYRNGKEAYVSFISLDEYDTPENEPQAITSAPKAADSDKIYVNIEAQPDEEILPNANILYFKGMEVFNYSWRPEDESDIQDIIDCTPVNATLMSNKTEGDINYLLGGLANAGIAIVSHTHGVDINGGFQIDNNYSMVDGVRGFRFYIRNNYIVYFEEKNTYVVFPSIFKLIDPGKGVALMNYCWSSMFGEFVEKNYSEKAKRDFVGYIDEAKMAQNKERVLGYLEQMLNGSVHSKALEKVNSLHYDDGQTFVSHNRGNDYRLFSIESRPPKAHTDKGVAEVDFKVKGWNNLKKDINSVKIWYSPEPFETPTDDLQFITMDFKTTSVYDYWHYNLWSRGSFPDGNDFYFRLLLEGLDSDMLYYCLGFEYNGKTYFGKIQSVANIRNGITQGQCIDLGLPSGTKWAAWNIGASDPSQKGIKAGWGDPTGTCTESDWSFDWEEYYGGKHPAEDISGSSYDICKKKWGNGWRLPTNKQWEELMNESYTFWSPYTYNNVNGVKIRSKINGNCIFIPYADYSEFQHIARPDLTLFWTANCTKHITEYDDGTTDSYYNGCIMFINNSWKLDGLSKYLNEITRWYKLYIRAVKK